MNHEIIPSYGVYQNAIDLTLYHAFAELVVETSQDDKARTTYRQICAEQIWQPESDTSTYFEQYGLRYPGEVLERFEEKLGNNLRTFRALALALGYTRSIQSENMFVGSQYRNFIQQLRNRAQKDVYLSGALYLLETDSLRRRSMLDELAASVYARTEEALFVLSLFDDREKGYHALHEQLVRLFQMGHTLPLEQNCGVLEWFVHFYEGYVKSYRGKADLVLRTLMKLPYMNMKPDSREFVVLQSAGYTDREITVVNSVMIWANRIPERLSSNSIPAERVAAACCEVLLNQTEPLPEEFYEYVGWLLERYKNFSIKYEGFPNLWQAIQNRLAPSTPKTILWMRKHIREEFPYRFDVFDPQYNILAKDLDRNAYMELFVEQLLFSRAAIPLKRWLARYHELTGGDLMEYFNRYHCYGERFFALMVERKAIDLWQFFEQHKTDGADTRPLELIRKYAVAVSSWRCFRFVKKLLGQYTFSELHEIFGRWFRFHESFVKDEGHYSSTCLKTKIARPFLTVEQHRQLYEWVDASVFQAEPEKYDDFVLSALEAPEVQRLYEKSTLAAVLRQLIKREKCNRYQAARLKKVLYSRAELEAEQKEAEEQEKAEREAKRAQQVINQTEKLVQLYDGSARSLVKFTRDYRYSTRRKEALDMAFEKLLEWPVGNIQTLPPEDAQCFFELCGELIEQEPRPRNEILKMICTVIGGEAA